SELAEVSPHITCIIDEIDEIAADHALDGIADRELELGRKVIAERKVPREDGLEVGILAAAEQARLAGTGPGAAGEQGGDVLRALLGKGDLAVGIEILHGGGRIHDQVEAIGNSVVAVAEIAIAAVRS